MLSKLEIVPITQKAAKAFVKKYHRHHKPPVGSVFQVACAAVYNACDLKTREDIEVYEVVGVAMVGRPVAQGLQDGKTLEVNRLCTDGTTKNVCSKLYSQSWRVAQSLGWKRLITYILETENGASLRAANWRYVGHCGGGTWNRKDRPRTDHAPIQKKLLFEAA